MKRIIMMLALAAFLVAALSVSALSAFADPKPCGTAGAPGGCRTTADSTTNNPNDETFDVGNSKKPGPHYCNPPGASQNTSKC